MTATIPFLVLAALGADLPPAPKPEDDAVCREMKRLVGVVELELGRLDRSLGSASRPGAAGEGAGRALGPELTGAIERGRGIQRSIDRILELAEQHVHEGGGT